LFCFGKTHRLFYENFVNFINQKITFRKSILLEGSGSWYNQNPSPRTTGNLNKDGGVKIHIPKPVRVETSTNPPRVDHSPGYFSFFRGLEKGFKHIPWPKKEDTKFHPDWMNGFRVIENYISQKEHDKFLAEVMEYSRTSNKITHFDF
jgi:hypothetical protein